MRSPEFLRKTIPIALAAATLTACGEEIKPIPPDQGMVVSKNGGHILKIAACGRNKDNEVIRASKKYLSKVSANLKSGSLGDTIDSTHPKTAGYALENLPEYPVISEGSVKIPLSEASKKESQACSVRIRVGESLYEDAEIGDVLFLPEVR